jgi:predicted transcriptional regulator
MAKAIDTEMIVQINELYKKIGTYAGVAREIGISATTVRKYVRDDYVAIADMKIKRADIGECRKIIENYNLTAEILADPLLLELTDEEYEGMKELWEEIAI